MPDKGYTASSAHGKAISDAEQFYLDTCFLKDGVVYYQPPPRPLPFQTQKGGYRKTCVKYNYKNIVIMEHRLVWLLTHGSVPKVIDHANGDRADNRIENLRAATQSLNRGNSSRVRGRDLPKGVVRVSNNKKNPYRANLKSQYLGSYPTPEEAHAAYVEAAKKYYGEFLLEDTRP